MLKKELYKIIEDTELSYDTYARLAEAKEKMEEFGYNQLEIIFNKNNLVGLNNTWQNMKYILGMKIDYKSLDDGVSFIIKQAEPEIDYKQKYYDLKNRIADLVEKSDGNE